MSSDERPAKLAGLLGAAEVRRLAAELELSPTKKLGQNFVVDANTVRRIVKAAKLQPDDVVLEVGPGLGSLTLAILEQAQELIAVEIDERLATRLPVTVAEHGSTANLSVIHQNALRVTGDEIRAIATKSDPTALVANLPYNVAVPVILHLLEQLPSLRRVLVMVQSEVAERLCAGPGSKTYGSPSAKLAWWGDATAAGNVSRTIFWPVPGVDSSLVAVDVRGRPPIELIPGEDAGELRKATFRVIDAAFAQRRKMLRSALNDWAGSSSRAGELLTEAGIDPTARGEALPVTAFAALARVAVRFKA